MSRWFETCARLSFVSYARIGGSSGSGQHCSHPHPVLSFMTTHTLNSPCTRPPIHSLNHPPIHRTTQVHLKLKRECVLQNVALVSQAKGVSGMVLPTMAERVQRGGRVVILHARHMQCYAPCTLLRHAAPLRRVSTACLAHSARTASLVPSHHTCSCSAHRARYPLLPQHLIDKHIHTHARARSLIVQLPQEEGRCKGRWAATH
jgi:hypothetical protein